jgi:hypothetical protein
VKKITLLAALLIISCTKPEIPTQPNPTPVVCNVQRYTEVRTITFNNSGSIISDTGFVENGAKSFYSNNCNDCGKILPGGYSGTTLNIYAEIRYVAKCK